MCALHLEEFNRLGNDTVSLHEFSWHLKELYEGGPKNNEFFFLTLYISLNIFKI